jgi:molecular chaperone GrpE (heat shock protein)
MASVRKGSKYTGIPLLEKELLEGLEKEGVEVEDLMQEEFETEPAPSPKPTNWC